MNWSNVIQADAQLSNVKPKEIWLYRDLIRLFVWRDFVSVYKQTVLGPLWFVFQPMITTIVYTIVFSKIARISTNDVPPFLFYMVAVLPWSYFSSCLTTTSNTFLSNAGLFGKIYFPRLIMPITVVISNLLTFCFQFLIFLAVYAFYLISGAELYPNLMILLTPLLLLLMGAQAVGVGMIISSLTTRYKDLLFVLGFGVQLWMYATPVVYPLSQVPEKWHWLIFLNPMTAPMESFRYAFFGTGGCSFTQLALSVLITLIIFTVGLILFSRAERTFIDTI
jgi:lipopolysaccharide transport system permease protein